MFVISAVNNHSLRGIVLKVEHPTIGALNLVEVHTILF